MSEPLSDADLATIRSQAEDDGITEVSSMLALLAEVARLRERVKHLEDELRQHHPREEIS